MPSNSIPWDQLNKPPHLRKPQYRGAAFSQPKLAKLAPASRPSKTVAPARKTVEAKSSHLPEVRAVDRTEIPVSRVCIKPQPLSAYDDNSVLNDHGAAIIVGVSVDFLKKWRQRNQGPDYIEYGRGGTIRYELKSLMEFRDEYKISLSSKRERSQEATTKA